MSAIAIEKMIQTIPSLQEEINAAKPLIDDPELGDRIQFNMAHAQRKINWMLSRIADAMPEEELTYLLTELKVTTQ